MKPVCCSCDNYNPHPQTGEGLCSNDVYDSLGFIKGTTCIHRGILKDLFTPKPIEDNVIINLKAIEKNHELLDENQKLKRMVDDQAREIQSNRKRIGDLEIMLQKVKNALD